jgi:hypothetical protein
MKTVMVNGKKFKGVKPPDFCFWVFDLLGLTPEDELADVYPGSGAVSEAWQAWKGARPLTPNSIIEPQKSGTIGKPDHD